MPLRYVILRHEDIPDPHYDLMFESAPGSPLMTWRGPDWPITAPTPLIKLPDHRAEYLVYEGPLSNNRGVVRRVALGQCEITPCPNGWRINMHGQTPDLLLVQINNDEWLAQ